MKYRWFIFLGLLSISALVGIQLITGEAWVGGKGRPSRAALREENPTGFYLVNAFEVSAILGIWFLVHRERKRREKLPYYPSDRKR